MNISRILYSLIFVILAISVFWLYFSEEYNHVNAEDHHDHEHEHAENEAHGEHGGRLRMEMSRQTQEENKIGVETASAKELAITKKLNGKIAINEDALISVIPRYSGVAKKVFKKLGDKVEKNEVLVIIESNETLKEYEVKSDIAGTVIMKNIAQGSLVPEHQTIYEIADLSTVWADLYVYKSDLHLVEIGHPVVIEEKKSGLKAESAISYISPIGHEETQSIIARSVIDNRDGKWKPGLFVTGEVTLETVKVPVAVRSKALQKFRDRDVVFVKVDDTFEAIPVTLGKRNQEWVEIVSGLKSGENYVTDNSFIIKADLGKDEAAHDH